MRFATSTKKTKNTTGGSAQTEVTYAIVAILALRAEIVRALKARREGSTSLLIPLMT
jgi:hypothetical protein